MMIPIKDNVLVNTEKISVIELKKSGDKVRIEVLIDGKYYAVDDNKINDEFRRFLRGDGSSLTKQFISL